MASNIISAIINSILLLIVAGAITAFFCSWYAKRNGDAWGEWFVLGAIYPFFIAIPAIIFCSRPPKK
jgi:hypothetical protein